MGLYSNMEHPLRRAASSLCGRCATSLRGQLVARNGARALVQLPAFRARYYTTAPKSGSAGKVTSRDFTTSSKAEQEAEKVTGGAYVSPGGPLKLEQDNLFHPLSESPIPKFRERAAFMRQYAYCPHPDHQHTKVPTIGPKPDDVAPTGGPVSGARQL